MERDSSVHGRISKKRKRPEKVEEEIEYRRPREAPTHSGCAESNTCHGSFVTSKQDSRVAEAVTPPQEAGPSPDSEGEGMVIQLSHCGDVSWHTEEDGSDTSTPDFKRGRHGRGESSRDRKRSGTRRQEHTDEQARRVIECDGLKYKIPKWMKNRPPSALVLCDSRIED